MQKKLSRLKKIIARYGSCVVAFSGGVDSTFLLKVASLVLPKDKLLAVTADSATYPKEELKFSKEITGQLGVRHKVIRTQELKDARFIANPVNRCYFCKKELFAKLKNIAARHNLNFVLEAGTITDRKDFRPGNIAKKELKVRSPLEEAGFTKEEIRGLSRQMGLATWNKPSLACLASRLAYGIKISPPLLSRIHRIEVFLRGMGFGQVRLRHYDSTCRIEVEKKDIPRLMHKRTEVVDKLKKLGYNYVTIDLEGYRSGSLNEVLRRTKR